MCPRVGNFKHPFAPTPGPRRCLAGCSRIGARCGSTLPAFKQHTLQLPALLHHPSQSLIAPLSVVQHLQRPGIMAGPTVPDLPFDVVESVSRQLQVLPKLPADLLLVSRSWKSKLLPTIRAQKNWVSSPSPTGPTLPSAYGLSPASAAKGVSKRTGSSGL
jgi:hypothetical protein